MGNRDSGAAGSQGARMPQEGVTMPHRTRLLALVVLLALCVTAPAARASGASDAADVELFTIPHHVWNQPDRIDVKGQQDCFFFNLVVHDLGGRALEPKSATLRLYSGSSERKTVTFSTEMLLALRGTTFTKDAGLEETFDLHHHFCEPA